MKKLIIPALLALAVTGALTLGGCPIEDVEDFLVIPWKAEVKHIGMVAFQVTTDKDGEVTGKKVANKTNVATLFSGDTAIVVDDPSNENAQVSYVTWEGDSVESDTVSEDGVIVICVHGRKVYVGD